MNAENQVETSKSEAEAFGASNQWKQLNSNFDEFLEGESRLA